MTMNVRDVQTRLAAAGLACGIDGAIGPQTFAAMLGYAAGKRLGPLGEAMGEAMARELPAAVTSDLGLAHWIAQACHETGNFRTLYEYGGPTYFQKYDGRADLGNTEPGDGYRYRGRGVFQLTGRANYARFGAEIAEPLEDNPDLAAQPGIAVVLAARYWADRHIQPLADADDCAGVTRKINGGLNGLQDRQAITTRLKRLIGLA